MQPTPTGHRRPAGHRSVPLRRPLRPPLRRLGASAATAVLALAGSMALLAPGAAAHDGSRPSTKSDPASGAGAKASARVPLPAGLRPEGITSGPGTRYYVGSLADGRIVTGDLRHRGPAEVLLPGATGRQIRGLYWDRRSRLLWAAGNQGQTGQPGTAWVWAIDSRTGSVVRQWTIPGGAFLNDLVATRTAVWVTDSNVDRLTKIPLGRNGRPAGKSPTFVALGGDWPDTGPGQFGANGIRTLPDGDLLLNNSTAGGLWAVDRHSGTATRIPVRGTQITSGDGLLRSGRTVYVVRGTQTNGGNVVDVLRLRHRSGTWTADYRCGLTGKKQGDLDVPSTATLAGDRLWAVNARFGIADPGAADYWITRLPARC